MAKIKDLFSGRFNYSREIFVMYRYAFSEKQAWRSFCEELSEKHNVRLGAVMNIFDGSKNNYEIKNETHYKEIEDEKQTDV